MLWGYLKTLSTFFFLKKKKKKKKKKGLYKYIFDLIHLEACRPVLPQRCFPVVVPGLDVGDSEHCAVRNHEQTDKLLGALPSEQPPRLLAQGSE